MAVESNGGQALLTDRVLVHVNPKCTFESKTTSVGISAGRKLGRVCVGMKSRGTVMRGVQRSKGRFERENESFELLGRAKERGTKREIIQFITTMAQYASKTTRSAYRKIEAQTVNALANQQAVPHWHRQIFPLAQQYGHQTRQNQ